MVGARVEVAESAWAPSIPTNWASLVQTRTVP